uniref:Lipoprotein n=1 Tax=viral metagenome TaxID=1070528 RepID=A0A6M3K0S4_9ZZZZ
MKKPTPEWYTTKKYLLLILAFVMLFGGGCDSHEPKPEDTTTPIIQMGRSEYGVVFDENETYFFHYVDDQRQKLILTCDKGKVVGQVEENEANQTK